MRSLADNKESWLTRNCHTQRAQEWQSRNHYVQFEQILTRTVGMYARPEKENKIVPWQRLVDNANVRCSSWHATWGQRDHTGQTNEWRVPQIWRQKKGTSLYPIGEISIATGCTCRLTNTMTRNGSKSWYLRGFMGFCLAVIFQRSVKYSKKKKPLENGSNRWLFVVGIVMGISMQQYRKLCK